MNIWNISSQFLTEEEWSEYEGLVTEGADAIANKDMADMIFFLGRATRLINIAVNRKLDCEGAGL